MTTPANISRRDLFIASRLTGFMARNSMTPEQCEEAAIDNIDAVLARIDAQPEAPKAQGEAVSASDCLACGHIINVHYKRGCGVAGCTCDAFIGGAAKASPPAPAPVKGEEKCVHCGKVFGDHHGFGHWCEENSPDDHRYFTPAPQPTEQKAETPAPDAELAAAKESLVQKTLKHVEYVRAVGFTWPRYATAQAVLDAVDTLLALESGKAEAEWPKVFIGKDGTDVRVMRGENDGDFIYKGKDEGKTCCSVSQIRASSNQRELPRNEVASYLKSINYNADGTKAVQPASTHRYRLLEDGMMIFEDGPLEALQAWVNKIAAEDKAVQPC